MGGYSRFVKVLLVGFCWLLLVGLMISTTTSSGRGINTSSTSGNSYRRAVLTSPRRHEEVAMGNKEKQNQKEEEEEQKGLVYNPELDNNYMMNKRKVPNGPDPIHNRKRPPGQV